MGCQPVNFWKRVQRGIVQDTSASKSRLEGRRGRDLGEGGPPWPHVRQCGGMVHLGSPLRTEMRSQCMTVSQRMTGFSVHLSGIALVTGWAMDWSEAN